LNTELVSHPNGAVVPLDEPAVAARRAEHLASRGAAYAAAVPIIAAGPAIAARPAIAAGPIAVAGPAIAAGPIAVAGPAYAAGYGYSGPLNLNTELVAHPNGAVVPLDEPAVAARRAEHLASRGAALAAW